MKSTGSPALPMPFTGRRGGAKFSRAEWDKYRVCRAAHLKRFPDYDTGWHRPDSTTVDAVWSSLGAQLPSVDTMLPAIRQLCGHRQSSNSQITWCPDRRKK